MNNKLIKTISSQIWDNLIKFKDEDNEKLWVNPDEQSLSYIEGKEEINDKDAKILIEKWVGESLKRINRVYLYHCPDNALVSIEKVLTPKLLKESNEEALWEKQGNLPFYIGFD